ncbi:MAG: hypothetical protein GDA51_09200 [Ekhidna sp.]|nr:hypothetical protein [Ekhidna sp.]
MEVFVVLSFRWLNLEGFYAYTIPQKKPSPSCKGFMTDTLLLLSFKPPRFSKPWRFCVAVVSLVKP